jgi:hypothetical protein
MGNIKSVLKMITNCLSSILLLLVIGCHQNGSNEQAVIKYLSVDSTYKSTAEKQKFDSLKKHFLNIWLNDSNCYRGKAQLQKIFWADYKKYNKKVQIGNILHSVKYDTLLVLVSWYLQDDMTYPQGRTMVIGMGVTIDKYGTWEFRCDGGTHYYEYLSGEHCAEALGKLDSLVVDLGYFKKYTPTINPHFWTDLYGKLQRQH